MPIFVTVVLSYLLLCQETDKRTGRELTKALQKSDYLSRFVIASEVRRSAAISRSRRQRDCHVAAVPRNDKKRIDQC